ncbi:MAG: ABC transporter ATP-binding protein [Firmicutes bacterium]|nr:ABC transporter ATP-binding protein [Bacillota bacterium]
MPPGGQPRNGKLEKPKDVRQALARILSYLARYRVALAIIILFSLLSNAGNLMGPKLAGKAIHEAEAGIGQVNFERVGHYALAMLLVYAASGLITLTVNICMMRISRRVGYQMRKDVFHKLLSMPVKYFDRNLAGDIISRVSYDIDVLTTSLATDLVQILTSAVTVAGSLIMMISISRWLSLSTLITIPLAVIITKTRGNISRPLFAKRSAAYGRMNGFVEEKFSGQKTILAYAYENGVCEDFRHINGAAADAYSNAQSVAMTAGPLVGFVNNLGLALVSLGGGALYILGMANLEVISSFVLYSRKFSGPINEIANIFNEIISALAAAERVFRFLDEEEETADQEDALVLEDVKGKVECRDVSFGYVPGQPVLKRFNLEADAGKTIAIVGHTGAGKTTIINLLMRFYDVDSGQILIDGHEVRAVTRDSLRRSFAMVLQDTWLFNGTIFDNIAYGKEGATMDEVVAAAKAARIHNTIMQLPQGYGTVITEDGGNISKGQKQLLTIARAMLYDARMLILDEATSNVDTETEKEVQVAIRRLMAGKTSFVIAHRLSTIEKADKILVVEHGDVVEEGRHEELMKARGAYYKLYAAQFE